MSHMKKTLGILGLAAAGMLSGQQAAEMQAQTMGINQTAEKPTNAQQQKNTPNQSESRGDITSLIKMMPFADYGYMTNDGIPPKQWGEYLQKTGRQKWTKKRNC